MPVPVEQYRQVISSYTTRPGFRWMVLPSTFAWLSWLAVMQLVSLNALTIGMTNRWIYFVLTLLFFMLPLILLFAYTVLVAAHVREQLTNPQTYVVPHFRKPMLHVAVVAMLLGPLTSFAAMMITNWLLRVDHVYPPALLAIAFIIVTPTAWMASWRSPWMALFFPLALLTLGAFTGLGTFIIHLWEGSLDRYMPGGFIANDAWCILIIAIGLQFLFLLYVRIKHFTAESLPRSIELPDRAPAFRMPTAHIRHEPIISSISRIWHRRRGVLDPSAPWAVALLLSLLLVGYKLLNGGTSYDMLQSLLLPACVPGAIVSVVWRERLLNIQVESLYPASRRKFVNELVGAAALSLAEMWAATLLAALMPILIWHNQIGLEISLVLVVIGASALMQVLVFGVMLLVSLHGGTAVLYANVLTIVAVVIPIEETFGSRPSLTMTGLITVALAELAAGIILTFLGTTAWRRADLA